MDERQIFVAGRPLTGTENERSGLNIGSGVGVEVSVV